MLPPEAFAIAKNRIWFFKLMPDILNALSQTSLVHDNLKHGRSIKQATIAIAEN
jgi:hypothetical protein